jgi:hypothetical protein
MSEEKKYLGSLFGVINYTKIEDLDKFVNEMKRDHALYCLIQAVNYAYSQNIFSMDESEVVSKSIRILSSPPKEEESNLQDPEIYKA